VLGCRSPFRLSAHRGHVALWSPLQAVSTQTIRVHGFGVPVCPSTRAHDAKTYWRHGAARVVMANLPADDRARIRGDSRLVLAAVLTLQSATLKIVSRLTCRLKLEPILVTISVKL